MPHHRLAGFAASVAALLLAAVASAAVAVDAVVPMNGTATGEVPAGGRASGVGVLVAAGTTKGTITVKAAKGSLLIPRVTLVWPDGTARDEAALLALGASVKATVKSVTIKNLPVFDASGLYKVLVTGGAGADAKPTSGGFTVKLGGKGPAGLPATAGSLATVTEKDDFILEIPENGSLTLSLKPGKTTPFGASLKLLAASGDEIDYTPWRKIGLDDSISIKKMPMPFFGRTTLRVGSTAAVGAYTLSAKVKALKKPVVVAGVPVADAGGPYVLEPSGRGNLDGSGTTGATSYLWVPVSGPPLPLGNKVVNPALNATATRATYAWQLVARNAAGNSLPSLAILEIDRAPVADAGPSAAVLGGSVLLDGSASTDMDAGDTLHYAWEQVSGPAAPLSDPFAQKPSFTPSTAGTYVFSLVVHDGILPSERSLAVVSLGASASAADAGRFVVVRPQDTVYLSGLRSRKGDGTAPTLWAWTAHPSNTAAVTLAGADGPVASFTAPKQPARLRFRLGVEGDGTNTDEVTVVVTNLAPLNGTPVADAGGNLVSDLSAGFSLDGTGSADEGAVQSHEWMQVDGPDADLQAATSATASGTAPSAPATQRFLLMVHDGRKYGAPDAAVVAAGAPASAVADAGPDRTGTVGAILTLTSAASTPAPGETITSRQWTQLSGRDWYDVDLKDPNFDPAAANPLVEVPGTVSSLSPVRTLHFGLVVTDAAGASREDLVTVVFQDLPKNAAPSVTAFTTSPIYRPGATVSLASSATDADGDPLAFSWTQIAGPAVAITNANQPNASVTAPVNSATLVFRVAVSDNTGEFNGIATADVTFDVNRPPVVSVTSTPSTGPEGTLVTLDGSTSSDPDDASLVYAWTETPPVSGNPVTLTGASTATATFTQPAYTGSIGARRRTFRLTVTDAMGPSFAVFQTVNFTPNRGPVAPSVSAVGDRKMFYTDSAASSSDRSESLSVSLVTDQDGDPLTFTWTVESGPITSTSILLSSTSGSSVTFKSAPRPTQSSDSTGGVYVVGVTSTDGVEQSTMTKVDLLVTSSFAGDVYPVFTGTCGTATSGCHGASAPGNGLRLDGGASTARTNLLNGRVTANGYSNSLLYLRLVGSSAGNRMPQGGAPLASSTVNMIRDWIEPEWNASPKPGFSGGAENN
jgi:hypothetical protein